MKYVIFFFQGKAIIDYLEKQYVEECKKSKSKKPATSNNSLIAQKKTKKAADLITEFDRINVLHFNHSQQPIINKVVMEEATAILEIRPFIICCICKDLDLETGGNFKKFLTIQVN